MNSKIDKNKKSVPETGKRSASKNIHDLGHMATEEQLLRLSCAVESLRDAVHITDFDHNIIYANPAIELAQGYKPEEVIGNKASEFFEGVPGNPPDLAGLITKEARNGFWIGEIFNRRKDGTIFPVQLIENTIYGQKGEVLGYIGISRDISERKRSETTNRRLAEIARNATDGIILTDPKGRIIYVNPTFKKMSGYRESELLDHDPAEFIVTDNPIALGDEIRSSVRKKGEWTGELLCRRKNGEIYPVESRVFAIRNAEGELVEMAAIQQDVTERKKMEEELLKTQKLESVGILAGGLAHDFNNILTSILGNISISKLKVEPENRIFEYLSKAESACGRAKNLTQQLLTFSKGGTPVKKIVSLSGLLKEAASFALHGTNVSCEFSLADDLWPVEVDEGQISQALNNLIINADQAMPEGGTIKLKAENINLKKGQVPPLEKGKYIKVSIEDRGIGIPARYIDKVFDPFFSTKKKGSGLGLATAYSIVKNHNGTITVESRVGEGTTFFIYLPASEKAPAEKKEPENKIAFGEGRILIMDDEEPVRDVIGRLLTRIGYEIECAENGTEAVAIYQKAKGAGRPFNAVILDLTIPGGGGGKEALQNLKKIDPGVKAIVSSGYSTDPIMSNFKEYGFRGIITKPFKIKKLSEILHKVIAGD